MSRCVERVFGYLGSYVCVATRPDETSTSPVRLGVVDVVNGLSMTELVVWQLAL